MIDINRRSVCKTLAAGIACVTLPELSAAARAQSPPTLRVRENVISFSKDEKKVASLRAGVAAMKRRSVASQHDKLGWSYWAAIHGTDERPPRSLQSIYNQCRHSSTKSSAHFLSWHRAYLHFFESVLVQAAKNAGGIEFSLPYWDWYTLPTVPSIFTEGTAETNPLLHQRENTKIDSQSLLKVAFDQRMLLAQTRTRGFSFEAELNPHNRVHGLVGGDMGDPALAARDPLFLLHHANADRLWSIWINEFGVQGMPASGGPWDQESFRFDMDKTWSISASGVRDAQRQLGYRYEDEALPLTPPTSIAEIENESEADDELTQPNEADLDLREDPTLSRIGNELDNDSEPRKESGGATPGLNSEKQALVSNIRIAGKPIRVDLAWSQDTAARIADEKASVPKVQLIISGIDVQSLAGRSLTVIALIPESSGTIRRMFVTELNTFTLKLAQEHATHNVPHGDKKKSHTAVLRVPIDHVIAEMPRATLRQGASFVLDPGAENITTPVSIEEVRLTIGD